MSYKDLKKAQAKRIEKEAAKAAKEAKGKGKRSWKRKRAILVADALEPEADAPEADAPEAEAEADAEPEVDALEPNAKLMQMRKALART